MNNINRRVVIPLVALLITAIWFVWPTKEAELPDIGMTTAPIALDDSVFSNLLLGKSDHDWSEARVLPITEIDAYMEGGRMPQGTLVLSCESAGIADRELGPACSNAQHPRILAYSSDWIVVPGQSITLHFARSHFGEITLSAMRLETEAGKLLSRVVLPTQSSVVFEPCVAFFAGGCDYRQRVTLTLPETLPDGPIRIVFEAAEGESFTNLFGRTPRTPDVTLILADWTATAYRKIGGGSLYGIISERLEWDPVTAVDRITRASHRRPMDVNGVHGKAAFASVVAMLEAQGIAVGICDTEELDSGDCTIDRDKSLVLLGHQEYWTDRIWDRIDDFVREGGQIVNFSGNIAWWRTRTNEDEIFVFKGRDRDRPDPEVFDDTGLFTVRRSYRKPHPQRSPARLFGLSYRIAGYPALRHDPNLEEDAPSRTLVAVCDHPLLAAVDVRAGDRFLDGPNGIDSAMEIDGIILTEDGLLGPETYLRPGSSIRVFGEGFARRKRGDPVFPLGIAAEYLPYGIEGGSVLSIGSVGAILDMSVADSPSSRLLLAALELPPETEPLAGCPWLSP